MRRPALLTAVALLGGLLTACGGGSSADTSGLPEVSGGAYGDKPKITIPEGEDPPEKLETEVLEEGDGPVVEKGDLIVADYLGATWRNGKTFDNSYDRGNPAAFTLTDGQGGVISGWVKGLTGTKAGSRVLMVVPPEDGYGKQGNPQAGIKGTDTLVFVVDVIASYHSDTELPERAAVADLPDGIPTVSGEQSPTVSIPKGTEPPKEPETTVLAKGTGDKVVKDELAIVQFTAVDWTGKPLSSSWERGPQGFPIGVKGQPSPFDLLEGVPIGSRVLLQLPAPADEDASTSSVAVVIDVLGQHGSAKTEANG
ncbi:MAG TPA: FKBP-type peptidyl-prolyl cis-trans isomerase [Actinomycetes bacterium]|nr:FKBP-type peptidyl-prolyl cis-trans isomerase [Actinomycetes bacterium]